MYSAGLLNRNDLKADAIFFKTVQLRKGHLFSNQIYDHLSRFYDLKAASEVGLGNETNHRSLS